MPFANGVAQNLHHSAHLANEGLEHVSNVGAIQSHCIESEHGKYHAGDEDPLVVENSNNFCENPVGYLCGGQKAMGKVKRLEALRQDKSFRLARAAQLNLNDSGDDVTLNSDLDSAKGGYSIFRAFAKAKQAIVEKLNNCTKCGNKKEEMLNRVRNVTLKIYANERAPKDKSDPIHTQRQKCGINMMSSNAEYVPEGNYVYICLGTIVSSTPAGLDWKEGNVGQYLLGVLGHEIGHAIDGLKDEVIGGQKTGNLIPENGIYQSYDSFAKCAASSKSIYDFKGSNYPHYESEINADFWSNVVMSEVGKSKPNARDALIEGRASLCIAKGGYGTHQKTEDRIRMIRNNPQIATLFNCSVQPGSCMNEGPVPLP